MQLIATDVTKIIKGKTILSNINLSLSSGNIYGFVGSNGSGKTMLFRALSGLISITSGEITLDTKTLKKDFMVLPNLGILLENISLYSNLTGYENLRYLAQFNQKASNEDIELALRQVGLDPYDKRKYGKYSLGMKQRLAIAQALMEKPDILMLDEPTNALDQDSIENVRKLIKQEKERGVLILLASHNKDDIQLLADYIYTIDNGAIVDEREKTI
jgi:ABC-2 type transport system ATP-binding protein